MIVVYIVFIVLLFVIAIQYFQFKDKKKPMPILFLSLFLVGIAVVFFVQRNIKSTDIRTHISWVETTIILLLCFVFFTIVILKYIYLKNNKQHTQIDKFWLYQSFSLIILLLLGLIYLYYQQIQKIDLRKKYYTQSVFVKNGICYADSLLSTPIQYTVIPFEKIIQFKIQSMDIVYRFYLTQPKKEVILIPEKTILLPISTIRDTIYFFVE